MFSQWDSWINQGQINEVNASLCPVCTNNTILLLSSICHSASPTTIVFLPERQQQRRGRDQTLYCSPLLSHSRAIQKICLSHSVCVCVMTTPLHWPCPQCHCVFIPRWMTGSLRRSNKWQLDCLCYCVTAEPGTNVFLHTVIMSRSWNMAADVRWQLDVSQSWSLRNKSNLWA